jgi:hypothetical protein
MDGDTRLHSGWHVIAETEEMPTIIDTILELDDDRTYTRSELADASDIPLKTLHLMDDVSVAVELGMLEKHDPEGEEVSYSVDPDSDVLAKARAFGEAVSAARSD